MPQIDDFFKPESMLTPGVAGGTTMIITNVLWAQFGLQPRFTGLAISFAFGLLVFISKNLPLWQKLIYWVINSLIIFSVALGSNTIGVSARGKKESQIESRVIEKSIRWLGLSNFHISAYAQETMPSKGETPSNADHNPQSNVKDLKKYIRILEEELRQKRLELKQMEKDQTQVEQKQGPVQAEQKQGPVQAEREQGPVQAEREQGPVQAEQKQEPIQAERERVIIIQKQIEEDRRKLTIELKKAQEERNALENVRKEDQMQKEALKSMKPVGETSKTGSRPFFKSW